MDIRYFISYKNSWYGSANHPTLMVWNKQREATTNFYHDNIIESSDAWHIEWLEEMERKGVAQEISPSESLNYFPNLKKEDITECHNGWCIDE